MIQIRPADQRGRTQLGWLDSRHSFSFGHYLDRDYMGFGPLRVINDDRVAPGKGFRTHRHADMEIVSYVVEGALEHRDSLGNGSVIRAGDIQRMSAGTGIHHSEFNPSEHEAVRFLQIWLVPIQPGLTPSYAQQHYPAAEQRNQLRLILSRDGRAGSVAVHARVAAYLARQDSGHVRNHSLPPSEQAWLQMVRGSGTLYGQRLEEGDGAALEDEPEFEFQALAPCEWLLFPFKSGSI